MTIPRIAIVSTTAAVLGLMLSVMTAPAQAALDTKDSSLIVYHALNENGTGNVMNDNVSGIQHFDTAPTGTAQNHDQFIDGASDGPAWGTGAAFQSGGQKVGTGTGLTFDRSDTDNSRFEPWMNVSQGAYTNGDSFTLMVRLYATSSTDNTAFNVAGHSSNFLQLEGVSGGTALRVDVRLREGAGGGESDFLYDSFGSTGASTAAGGNFSLSPNTWYNVFLIYEANTSVTVAADDGTTFQFLRTTDIGLVGASFDSLANGFADAGAHWALGGQSFGIAPANTFDGRIETLAIFDRALTDAEADAIDLVTVPEPGVAAMLAIGGVMTLARRRR